MARIRTMKPDFFRSHDMYAAELRANQGRQPSNYLNLRAAFLGLITASDREGRFKWRPAELKLDCLPYDAVDFAEVLEVLASTGSPPMVQRYQIDGAEYGLITGFCKHQRPKFDEAKSVLPPPQNHTSDDCPTDGGQSSQGREGKGREGKGRERSTVRAFAPPTLAEVQAFCVERKNRVDAQRWMDYYTSNGWRVGRNAMKDWRAAVRTWERNDYGGNVKGAGAGGGRVVGAAAPTPGKYDHLG